MLKYCADENFKENVPKKKPTIIQKLIGFGQDRLLIIIPKYAAPLILA